MSKIDADTYGDRSAGTEVNALYVVGGTAKAWARLSNTPAVSEGLNVSSVTDNGSGRFQPNFTNNFSTTTYGVSGTVEIGGTSERELTYSGPAVSDCDININESGAGIDSSCGFMIMGDLA